MRLILLALLPALAGCGVAVTVGSSLSRTSGAQTIEFEPELADEDDPVTVADVEVSARADNFDMYGLISMGPAHLSVGYGVQLVDVRARDAAMAPGGGVRPVTGEGSFSDRVTVGADLPLGRMEGFSIAGYAQAGFTGIASLLGFGARPIRNLEAGAQLGLVDGKGRGMILRVGVTLEKGYAERVGLDEFGFETDTRGEYDAIGLVVSIGGILPDIAGGK